MNNLLMLPLFVLLNLGNNSAIQFRANGFNLDVSQYQVNGQQPSQKPLNSNLPLVIIPSVKNEDLPLLFFISGDGGWTDFDQGVSKYLSEKGIPVVGLDARKYFWKEKQPLDVAVEITKVVDYYCQLWNKSSFVLIGYSFGACVVPFIAENFTPALQERLKGVYCLSPDLTGDFKIHVADLLNFSTVEKYDVMKEIKKIRKLGPVCIFGVGEDPQEQRYFTEAGIKVLLLPGEHHYNNDYKAVAEIILSQLLL
jgi:type IV secretory pathway VirJ component